MAHFQRLEVVMNALASFLVAATPTPMQALAGGPAGLAAAFAFISFAAWLKSSRGWRTGYTRKTFHFLVFFTVAILQATGGLPAVCLFGGAVSLVVFYSVLRGAGHPWYEALAREQDAPRRTWFVLAPYAATLLGGIAANLLFGWLAFIGYLVTGLGDAVGEPVGTRWGRHRYRVPSLSGVTSERSMQGSAAVFVVCLLVLYFGVRCMAITPPSLLALAAIALLCAVAEAVSPHGWDNATMQLVPTACLWWVLS